MAGIGLRAAFDTALVTADSWKWAVEWTRPRRNGNGYAQSGKHFGCQRPAEPVSPRCKLLWLNDLRHEKPPSHGPQSLGVLILVINTLWRMLLI